MDNFGENYLTIKRKIKFRLPLVTRKGRCFSLLLQLRLSSTHQNSRIGIRLDVLPVIFSQGERAGVCRFEISRASVTINRR